MKKAISLLVLMAAVAAWAQTPAQSSAPRPVARTPKPTPNTDVIPPVTESARVDITSIEVIVTDSKGNRVPGLTRDDFAILQDGIPQTITNFYAVDGTRVTLEDGKTILLDSKEAQQEEPPEIKSRYVLYIDNLNIQPENRNRMFERLKEFVGQSVGPRAEAEVVTYNRSLKVKQKFTSEAGLIVGALDDIEHETGGGTNLVGERRDAVEQINNAQSADEAQGVARTFARSLVNDLRFDLDSIREVFTGLGGLPGRKVFVYVSEGLPAIAGAELYDTVQSKFRENASTLEQFDFDMNARYVSLAQAANAQGVTFWALDASGLTTDSFTSAENRYMENRPNDFLMRENSQAPLEMLADQTGGMAAINTNDWKQNLDELAKDFTSYYSLGYRTAGSAVDKPHSLEVTVKRKGLRARYRKSLLEKTPETRIAETVLSALDYPRADNPLNITVRMDPAQSYQNDMYLLPLHLVLPIGKMGLVPSGDRYVGTYFVYMIVRDSSGDKSDMQIRHETISVPAKELQIAQSKNHPYELKLVVRPGAQRLSLAIRDGTTNQVSYFQKNFFVSVLPPAKKS